MPAPKYIISVDIGQSMDPTAVGGLRRISVPTGQTREVYNGTHLEMMREYRDSFHLGYAHRFPLHTPYPEIVDSLAETCRKIDGTYQVVADATGVGRPVVDMMRAAGMPVVGVIITGGVATATKSEETGYWHVPKRELVTTTQTMMQMGRLKVAKKLPLATTIVKELQAFKMKISTQSGHVSFEAWRDRDHDDLVLMLSQGVWWGNKTADKWQKDRGPHSGIDNDMRKAALERYGLDDSDTDGGFEI